MNGYTPDLWVRAAFRQLREFAESGAVDGPRMAEEIRKKEKEFNCLDLQPARPIEVF